MGQTAKKTKGFDPTTLNKPGVLALWFDDLGTGNESHKFLSNFYEGEAITLPGITWDALALACGVADASMGGEPIEFLTGEHAFAALKFWGSDYAHFVNIVNAPDPNSAKAMGRSRAHPLRPDWEEVKLDVMAAVVREKFSEGRSEVSMLLGTGDALLCEGTYWSDEVWGVALDKKGMPGRNWLGTLLMARRAEVRIQAYLATQDGNHEALAKRFADRTSEANVSFTVDSAVWA